ncbi:MAG: Holliday junction branch migration protein RuvA [Spirochaetes bacterium]|nr:Holliday junction branch migration protein RuvA [Spirochaetota bacterium]
MIGMLRGRVEHLNDTTILLITGGIGFEVSVGRHFTQSGDDITLFTHLIHREDAMMLFGFATKERKDMFLLLLSAQGIGPKIAMEIIGTFTPAELVEILFAQDVKRLTSVPGMGMKKAEKLIFELKDRIQKMELSPGAGTATGGTAGDAVKALIVLGFSPSEAMAAVGKAPSGLQTEALIKHALQLLAKK